MSAPRFGFAAFPEGEPTEGKPQPTTPPARSSYTGAPAAPTQAKAPTEAPPSEEQQVNELSQRPAANCVDELWTEVGTLKLMLSQANGERAIQIEILTAEKQKIIDDLQQQVYELLQRLVFEEVDELPPAAADSLPLPSLGRGLG